jgi:antitoxin (DNA-binding transcriptional repressor) of toxin-antitoxin stability system
MLVGVSVALLLAVACRPVEEHRARWSTATEAGAATTPADRSKAGDPSKAGAEAKTTEGGKAVAALFPVAPPPFSDGVFPCSECHGKTDVVNRTPHPVEFHEDIVLRHDEKNRWCLDCHDAQNRDKLHLADGRLVDFTESYRLCGQCHGPTLRNWKAGEHGKRTGSWNGAKQYLLCANCHNPHSPRFKPL